MSGDYDGIEFTHMREIPPIPQHVIDIWQSVMEKFYAKACEEVTVESLFPNAFMLPPLQRPVTVDWSQTEWGW